MDTFTCHAGHTPAAQLTNSLSSGFNGLTCVTGDGGYLSILDAVAAETLELQTAPTLALFPIPSDMHAAPHCWIPQLNIFIIASGRDITFYGAGAGGSASGVPNPGAGPSSAFRALGRLRVYFNIRCMAATAIRSAQAVPGYVASFHASTPLNAVLVAVGGANGVQLHVWPLPLAALQPQPAPPQLPAPHQASPWSVLSSTSSDSLSTGSAASDMLPSSVPVGPLDMLPSYLSLHLAFSDTGSLLAVAAADGHVGIWDVQALLADMGMQREIRIAELRKRMRLATGAQVRAARASATGAGGGAGGGGGATVGSAGSKGPVKATAAATSAAGGDSSGGGGGAIPSSSLTRVPAVGHGVVATSRITCLAFSPDDRMLAVACWDGDVLLFMRADDHSSVLEPYLVPDPPASIASALAAAAAAAASAAGPNPAPAPAQPLQEDLIKSLHPTPGAPEPVSGDEYQSSVPVGAEAARLALGAAAPQWWPAVATVDPTGAVRLHLTYGKGAPAAPCTAAAAAAAAMADATDGVAAPPLRTAGTYGPILAAWSSAGCVDSAIPGAPPAQALLIANSRSGRLLSISLNYNLRCIAPPPAAAALGDIALDLPLSLPPLGSSGHGGGHGASLTNFAMDASQDSDAGSQRMYGTLTDDDADDSDDSDSGDGGAADDDDDGGPALGGVRASGVKRPAPRRSRKMERGRGTPPAFLSPTPSLNAVMGGADVASDSGAAATAVVVGGGGGGGDPAMAALTPSPPNAHASISRLTERSAGPALSGLALPPSRGAAAATAVAAAARTPLSSSTFKRLRLESPSHEAGGGTSASSRTAGGASSSSSSWFDSSGRGGGASSGVVSAASGAGGGAGGGAGAGAGAGAWPTFSFDSPSSLSAAAHAHPHARQLPPQRIFKLPAPGACPLEVCCASWMPFTGDALGLARLVASPAATTTAPAAATGQYQRSVRRQPTSPQAPAPVMTASSSADASIWAALAAPPAPAVPAPAAPAAAFAFAAAAAATRALTYADAQQRMALLTSSGALTVVTLPRAPAAAAAAAPRVGRYASVTDALLAALSATAHR